MSPNFDVLNVIFNLLLATKPSQKHFEKTNITIVETYKPQAVYFGRREVGGVGVRGSITYRLTNPSLRPGLVCMVYPLPMNPTPPTSHTQIILPVLQTSVTHLTHLCDQKETMCLCSNMLKCKVYPAGFSISECCRAM